MYAIIENGGKQYKVVEGDTLQLEKLNYEVGTLVKDSKVLMIADGKTIEVGTPVVSAAEVVLKVVAHGKGEKVLVYKFKAKKNYRRKQGHRQPFTEVLVEQISLNGGTVVKEAKAEVKEAPAKPAAKAPAKPAAKAAAKPAAKAAAKPAAKAPAKPAAKAAAKPAAKAAAKPAAKKATTAKIEK